jgi:3',5'-cyclic-AMP phosphodiesterase
LQNPYYHFESKGWHFIVLDSTHIKEEGTFYTAKLDIQQRQWLESKLTEIPSNAPILIALHIPQFSSNSIFGWG